MLNHVELLHRPGELDLALELFEVLGCRAEPYDRVTSWIHVSPDDDDRLNNVLYVSEIRPEQRDLEVALAQAIDDDHALAAARTAYLHKMRTRPHGIPHFGLRYPSFDAVDAVLARLAHDLPPALAGRVTVGEVIRPGHPQSMTDELIQAFVDTDVVASGLFTFRQMIELQGQRLT